MVVIINGEIVQDNDPRAIAKRNSMGSGPSAANAPFKNTGPRIAGLHSTGSSSSAQPTGRQQQQEHGGADDQVDGILTPLSRLIGIEGRRVQIPPIPALKFTGYSFPLVHAVVSALIALLSKDVRYGLVCLLALAVLNPK